MKTITYLLMASAIAMATSCIFQDSTKIGVIYVNDIEILDLDGKRTDEDATIDVILFKLTEQDGKEIETVLRTLKLQKGARDTIQVRIPVQGKSRFKLFPSFKPEYSFYPALCTLEKPSYRDTIPVIRFTKYVPTDTDFVSGGDNWVVQ